MKIIAKCKKEYNYLSSQDHRLNVIKKDHSQFPTRVIKITKLSHGKNRTHKYNHDISGIQQKLVSYSKKNNQIM